MIHLSCALNLLFDHLSPLQICELDPGLYRDSETLMVNLQGRFEVLALSVHAEGDTHVDQYDDHEYQPSRVLKETTESEVKLSDKLQQQTISASTSNVDPEEKQNKCGTCNASVGDSKQFREHFKSEWHKHNLRRKTRNLPPLTEEECTTDMEIGDSKADLKDYSF